MPYQIESFRRIPAMTIGMKHPDVFGMVVVVAGYLPPVAGAIAQGAINAAGVLNALRMTLPAMRLRDEGI